MKIIHVKGHKYWVGMHVQCFRCGTVFELEEPDEKDLTALKPIIDHNRTIIGHLFSTICPTCEGVIHVNSADKLPVKPSSESLPPDA